jgi:hypothetical protein
MMAFETASMAARSVAVIDRLYCDRLIDRELIGSKQSCAREYGLKRETNSTVGPSHVQTAPSSNPPVPKSGVFNRPLLVSEINIS